MDIQKDNLQIIWNGLRQAQLVANSFLACEYLTNNHI